MTVRQIVAKVYRTAGIVGFYKGITASYFGISETVIHFVIYEAIKAKIVCIPFIHVISWCFVEVFFVVVEHTANPILLCPNTN